MLCGVTELGVARAQSLSLSRLSHSWFNEKNQQLSVVMQRGSTNSMTVVAHIDTTICVCISYLYKSDGNLRVIFNLFQINLRLLRGVIRAGHERSIVHV